MDRVHITAKKTGYSSLPYGSIVDGHEGLHYGPEELLMPIAHQVIEKYARTLITFRNHIPEDEGHLRETLDTLVRAHNNILLLGNQGDFKGRTAARRILKERS